MKESVIFVPPGVQTAAEHILRGKAYEIYHYSVADGSSDVGSTAFLESATVSENDKTSTPPFQPGSKVCLNYIRYPEPYVVLAVAYPPRSADAAASSSTPTSSVSEVTANLKTVALSTADSAETAATEAGTATATNADADADADTDTDTATATAAPVTKLTAAAPTAATPAISATTKYLYLVLPTDASSKLKPTVDISQAKVVYEQHLLTPPLYAVGRVLRFQIPISADGDAISLPVEIRKVVNNLGLDTMGGEPESKEWKYKFLHGSEWIPEGALVVLDEMTSASVLE